MKKSVIQITTAVVLTFTSFTARAQQADVKTKIDESNKTTEQDKKHATASAPAPAPPIVASAKALTLNEQPKPIIPGGEFKPMDTYSAVLPTDTKQATAITQPEVPAAAGAVLKSPEAIKGDDAANQQKARPVTKAIKQQ